MSYFPYSGGPVYELGEVPDCDVPAEVSEDVALCIHIYHSMVSEGWGIVGVVCRHQLIIIY